MQATPLSERLADWHSGLTVDSAARLVKNVALTGRDSKNGYKYAESALRGALPLYDQKPVFLDHAADRARPHERSTRDLVGTIINPRFEDGRIRGDIRVLDTESGRTFLALSTSNAPGVGMSHVVLARRSNDGATVEAIEDVVSVDAVINPATTTTFRESIDPQDDSSHRIDLSSLPQHTPAATDIAAQLAADQSAELESARTQIAELTNEVQSLSSQLASLTTQREQEARAQRMDALLSQSDLPDYALTPQFRQMFAAAPCDQSRSDMLRERLDLLHRAACHPPHSAPRRTSETPASTTAAFLAAIKRR